MGALDDRLDREGSIRFDEFVDLVLYGPDGFYAVGGGAGRSGGDFLTSPEVGPLFGAVVARYLDHTWERLGRPDEFVVVEAGAGRGALALAVLAAGPDCADSLRYVLVERSPALRARQSEHLSLAEPFVVLNGPREADPDAADAPPPAPRGPFVVSLPDLPAEPVTGVVLANELLDNLAFRVLERTSSGWSELRVTRSGSRLVELLVPADESAASHAAAIAPQAPVGARVPLQDRAVEWLRDAFEVLDRGAVLLFDYAARSTAGLAVRPWTEWLRTYVGHGRGGGPLDDPGRQDVTVEVAVDQLAALRRPDVDLSQTEWLRRWGLDELVDAGRQVWEQRAGVGDLAALRARSRVAEAEALTDPAGLGAFRALEWHR